MKKEHKGIVGFNGPIEETLINKDFKNLILERMKSNTDLQKQMLEVCKNSNSNTTNHQSPKYNSKQKYFSNRFHRFHVHFKQIEQTNQCRKYDHQ